MNTPVAHPLAESCQRQWSLVPERKLSIKTLYDYLSITKPGLTLASVSTSVGGALLAMEGMVDWLLLIHVAIGSLLAGSGAGALNQYLERGFDIKMARTKSRPLAGGRLGASSVLVTGTVLSLAGPLYVLAFTSVAAFLVVSTTLCIYLFLYTPLKRKTPFSLFLGAVAGAMPPLIGWSAVRGGISITALSLFFMLFFWQIPHFLSLAWQYREDYRNAGYKVIPPGSGALAGLEILVFLAFLLPASILPSILGMTGELYSAGAVILSSLYLSAGLSFSRRPSARKARRLFNVSLVYLPAVYILMVLDSLL